MLVSLRLLIITIGFMVGFPVIAMYFFNIGILYGDFGSVLFLITLFEIWTFVYILLNLVYAENESAAAAISAK